MPRTKRGAVQPVTPEQALQMLQSAIGYCQLAGLAVQAANSDAGLLLTVPGVDYALTADRSSAEFVLHSENLDGGTLMNADEADER